MDSNQKLLAKKLIDEFKKNGCELEHRDMWDFLIDNVFKDSNQLLPPFVISNEADLVRKELTNRKYIYYRGDEIWALTEKGIKFESWEKEEEKEKMQNEKFELEYKQLKTSEWKKLITWQVISSIFVLVEAVAIAWLLIKFGLNN